MIDFSKADAHIHLFEGGYQGGSLTSRPGVEVDELLCYQSLMKDHHIEAALVVGFEGDAFCRQNNDFLAKLIPYHPWMYALAYCHLDHQPDLIPQLENWKMKGFQGISLYLLEESDYTKLLAIPLEFWEWLVQNDWLVSVNSFGALWGPWKVVLKKQPLLKMIVSHLGLPGRQTEIPSREEVKSLMKPISELAEFSNVHVKLSGYYALTSPAHDFPHSSAWPLTEELLDHFGPDRLLWGSDFSPSLDFLSFPQTFELFNKMPFFREENIKAILGENLIRLLRLGEK